MKFTINADKLSNTLGAAGLAVEQLKAAVVLLLELHVILSYQVPKIGDVYCTNSLAA